MIPSDVELMRRVAGGDREAFGCLFDRLGPRVFGLALHLLRNRGDAEDVLQETFLRVWNAAGRFDPAKCPPDGWVLMITRCRAVDRLRHREAPAEPGPVPVADEPPPTRPLERQEDAERVAAALGCLPAEQAQVIRMAFYCGLTHDAIARQLGLPLGTVKTRIRLGMIRLRDRLGPRERVTDR